MDDHLHDLLNKLTRDSEIKPLAFELLILHFFLLQNIEAKTVT